MKLYGAIQKIEPQDDGTIKVFGIASSECVDDQGEVVTAAAMRAAIPDYMKFPALREMHQLSAAGSTIEAECGDSGVTRITAHVVDPIAVSKVKTATYRGFSIGGRVTQREAGNPKNITGLVLNEISLVDRPANPEATLDCWKASEMTGERMTDTAAGDPAADNAAKTLPPPVQIWACGVADHRHIAKADAMKCIEKRAADGADAAQAEMDAWIKKTLEGTLSPDEAHAALELPVVVKSESAAAVTEPEPTGAPVGDTGAAAVIAAAEPGGVATQMETALLTAARKSIATAESALAIDPAAKTGDAQPGAQPGAKHHVMKSLWDVGRAASIILDLDWLRDSLEWEAERERDDSPQPERLKEIIAELCGFLNALVAEETAELLADSETVAVPTVEQESGWPIYMAALTENLRKAAESGDAQPSPLLDTLTTLLQKARHSMHTQTMLDLAAYASKTALGKDTPEGDKIHIGHFHKAVLDAGATDHGPVPEKLTDGVPTAGAAAATQHSTVDTSKNPQTATPNPTGAVPATAVPASKKASAETAAQFDALFKAAGVKSHVSLMKIAHDAIAEISGGATCKAGAEKPSGLSAADLAHLDTAHIHFTKIGGCKCDAANALPGGTPNAAGETEGEGTANSAKTAVAGEGAAAVVELPAGADAAPKGGKKLAKALAALDAERAEKAALVKTMSDLVPMVDRLSKRVEEIAAAPMPATLVARAAVSTSLSKQGDAASSAGATSDLAGLSDSTIAAELAKRDPKTQHLIAVKASLANPIVISRLSDAVTQRALRDAS